MNAVKKSFFTAFSFVDNKKAVTPMGTANSLLGSSQRRKYPIAMKEIETNSF